MQSPAVVDINGIASAWQVNSSNSAQTQSRESTVTNSVCVTPSTLVPEGCLKEALSCEISPLGFYFSSACKKQKIWRGDYIDIPSLLPLSKENRFKKEDDKFDDDRRSIPHSFNNWLQSFCIFASVLG